MKFIGERAVNLILFLSSCLIAIAAVEISLRIYLSGSGQAVHLISSPSIVRSPEGLVKYSKDTMIRSVATDHLGIVYDLRFETNDFGFVDDVNYKNIRKDRNIVLLGDSFTAGYHGGAPWVSGLRGNLGSDVAIFNLGVSGTGIREFEKRLKTFAASVHVDDIYILVISNDFYRRLWYPVSNGNGLWFCSVAESEDECLTAKRPTFYPVDLQSTTDEILEATHEIRGTLPRKSSGFAIYRLLKGLAWKLQSSDMTFKLADTDVQDSLQDSLQAILRVADQFGHDRVFIVHLPERHELASGRYDLDLSEFAEINQINYIPLQETCPLTKSMFFRRDPHPNATGYQHIAQCMAGLITSHSVVRN